MSRSWGGSGGRPRGAWGDSGGRRRGIDSLRAALPGLRRTVRRFGPWLRPQSALIAGGLVALIAEIVLRLAEPWPLKLVLDRVIQPDPAHAETGIGWADRMDPGVLLVVAAVGVVVVVAVRALAGYAATVAFAVAGSRVLTEVRAELYRHLQRLSLRFHAQSRTGDLLTRVTSDVSQLQDVTVTAALPLLAHVATLVGMVAVMMWIDWRLALVAVSALPMFANLMQRLTTRIREVSRAQRAREGELASVAAEALGAITVVQAYSLEAQLERGFARSNAGSLREGVRAKRLSAGLERKTDVLVAIGTGAILFVGAWRVLAGQLTAGDLVVFVAYLKHTFKPMHDLAKYSSRLAKAAASGERIVDVLDTEVEVGDLPFARHAPTLRGDVRLEHVTFGYDPSRPVLHDVSLHVRPGQTVALVGMSGAGKSSVGGLLLRLYDPQRGRVRIDGVDIREFTLSSLRRQTAIVLQDSVLFATTIRQNIAFAAPGATDAEIEAAARLANAHEFIITLSNGYDTVVGERGATLSGGQRQRIAIARAALRQAPILVLDEPTTGLDRENEREVTEALMRLAARSTTFLITHDLAQARKADLIVALDGGRVVEVVHRCLPEVVDGLAC